MDLRKVRDEEKVDLCRKYFIGGFFLLPFLWAVNAVWFFRDAFFREDFVGQTEIRKYVVRSALGAFAWLIIVVSWNVVFQLNRTSWGADGDKLSVIIPLGIP
ncbi:gamma-secretase subunit pen-2-like [Varroa jacobsoni]|uniref:Gamma-secretase subunit PEN-2 n=1 Tax=Varroa destructor TaxID=109461 RepID=A0A7M7KKP6_VARDE|nr:gamma-secretase subunit PEN-2-like [Varroa destructor]XP_022668333.1 gamma-secretase subunit PEN-2-like [Varroa destructor]XP_022668334.1 gamma-secretase subunit PEN-2-like [Varroa destructor]XP_022700390.1 gamma-secretase subunit pen-2-like [Varroa jacobsoni]